MFVRHHVLHVGGGCLATLVPPPPPSPALFLPCAIPIASSYDLFYRKATATATATPLPHGFGPASVTRTPTATDTSGVVHFGCLPFWFWWCKAPWV